MDTFALNKKGCINHIFFQTLTPLLKHQILIFQALRPFEESINPLTMSNFDQIEFIQLGNEEDD